MAKRPKLSKQKKTDLIEKMMKFRKEAEDGNKGTFIRMTENEGFKNGRGQWRQEDINFNEAHGKFALTVNEVQPIILDIAGTQEENPLDYKVRNVKGGSQTIAEILTALAKNVMDKSMGLQEASRAFESGVSIARGFLHVDIEFDNDPLNGDFVIRELDPFMVLPDPTCKEYDYNKEKGGAKYIIIDDWEDKEKMDAKHPDAELKKASFDPVPLGRFMGIMNLMFGGGPSLHLKDDYRHHDEHNTPEEELGMNVSKQVNNYRVSTYWWKEWKKGAYVQRVDDPLNYLALTDPKEIKIAKDRAKVDENIRVIEKDRDENQLTVAVLNKTKMVGNILIEHIEDPFDGMNLFLTARFAPYFDHGYEYPPVENLKGPQKLLNFAFSTMVNILKNLANTGWIIGKGSQQKIQELEESSSKDGLVLNKTDYGSLEKIAQTEFPVGFDIIAERSKQNMRSNAQVQLEVPTKRAESGKALAIREQQSIKTKGIIFRNWNQMNIIIARTLFELIRNTNVFSDDEIMAIIDEEDLLDEKIMEQAQAIVINQIREMGGQIPKPPKRPNPIRARNAPPELQAQMLDAYEEDVETFGQFITQVEQAAIPIAKDIILDLLRKMQQGRYGAKVDTSPMAPTVRMARRFETLELDARLIEGGRPGISRRRLIEDSDIQNKEEVIAEEVQTQGAV